VARAAYAVALWSLVPSMTGVEPALAVVALLPAAEVAASVHQRELVVPQVVRDLPRLALASALAVGAAIVLAEPMALRDTAGLALLALAVLLLARVLVGAIRRRAPGRAALVVGSGQVAATLVDTFADRRYGVQVVGIVDDSPPAGDGSAVPYLGGTSALPQLVRDHGVRLVVIAFGRMREVDLVDTIRRCSAPGVEICAVPRLFELRLATSPEHVRGIPLVRIAWAAQLSAAWRAKRIFDVVVAAACLVAFAPLLGVVALLVRCSSPGPVLFRQERLGQHGRPFELLKFRSMHVNDDQETTWSVDGDARVTRIGAFLRATSLDELPQLWNVVIGDMSLVGPRPERPHFAQSFADTVPRYQHRLRAPVGMTGLAQVNGLRGDTSIDERVWFDNFYIEHWSLWSDLLILARTALTVCSRPHARVGSVDDPFPVARAGFAPPLVATLVEEQPPAAEAPAGVELTSVLA